MSSAKRPQQLPTDDVTVSFEPAAQWIDGKTDGISKRRVAKKTAKYGEKHYSTRHQKTFLASFRSLTVFVWRRLLVAHRLG